MYSGNLFVDVSKNLGTYFEDCEFLTNSAMGEGGALYLIDQPLILKSSKFLSNTVHSSSEYFSDSAPLGGAVWYSSRYVRTHSQGTHSIVIFVFLFSLLNYVLSLAAFLWRGPSAIVISRTTRRTADGAELYTGLTPISL